MSIPYYGLSQQPVTPKMFAPPFPLRFFVKPPTPHLVMVVVVVMGGWGGGLKYVHAIYLAKYVF